MWYANGTTYIGAWKDDKRNGLGTLKYADGTTYYGEWKDDMWHGLGTLTLPDGSTHNLKGGKRVP